MKTTVTITSKRQLTIPKKVWKELDLEGVRYLEAEVENDGLKLKKINFGSQLDTFWDKTSGAVKGTLSDASIKQASRNARKTRSIV
ncbi:MAG: AbrB/MazE/SpoVT family DNA-binding domain-containing protein [Candidatus Saccharimonadales bacterium]